MPAAAQIAGEPDRARRRERAEPLDLRRLDQPVDRLEAGDAGGGEDGEHDREPRPALGAGAAEGEGDTERDRRRGVAHVVDQVGEQRHAARGEEDDGLERGRQGEDAERERDRAQPRARAADRVVDEAVRVPVRVGAHRLRRLALDPPLPAGEPEPDVLDVPEHLLEQLGDVVVVELVDDAAAGALADDEAEVAEHAELVRDRRRVHPDGGRDLGDRRGAVVQAGEDPQPARRGERLEAVGGGARVGLVVEQAGDVGGVAMAHAADDT